MITFTKMHGAGNDFILINDLSGGQALSKEKIARLCERRFGIGADGLMFLRVPREGGDARMVYHNSDGGEAEMCGNGARCFALFARRELGWKPAKLTIETLAGKVGAEFVDGQVRLKMTRPTDWREPVTVETDCGVFCIAHVNTGVPHAVARVNDVSKVDVARAGRMIRFHSLFSPAGANANFFELTQDGTLILRTYERGVEGETLACGTGVVATALVAEKFHNIRLPARVLVRGGDVLRVERDALGEIYLTGPAVFVFEGRTF